MTGIASQANVTFDGFIGSRRSSIELRNTSGDVAASQSEHRTAASETDG